MEKANDRISALQFGVIAFFLTGGLFVGMGIVSMFSLNARDAWIASLIGFGLSIIPLLLLIYILNYHPDKNVFEKNKILFGKWLGTIFNFILTAYIFYIALLVLWSNTSFAITMYLTKTPEYFVGGIFLLAAAYAIMKGIEPIGRMTEILFLLTIIILLIIISSLSLQWNMDLFKPILVKGISPVFKQGLNFASYFITPLIILSVIPKNNIVKSKNMKWYLLGGVFVGFLLMFAVFTLIPGVITPELSSVYRFPAYYILRKISIGGVINNLENFLALHWFFNTFLTVTMGLYFVSKFFDDLFKIKQPRTKNTIIIVICFITLMARGYLFDDSTIAVKFMKYQFPLYFSGTLLVLVLIMCCLIMIKKHKKRPS